MNLKMLKNDFKRNRAGNLSLLLFIIFAAGLVVVATIIVTQLITSMLGMYETAKPPHFLQMHKGELNQDEIDDFVSSYDVTAWQTVEMIDIYGDDLKVYGKDDVFSLSDCRLDISLVKQNKEYDMLLDNERNIIKVNKGEIGVPVILLDSYDIKLGDTVLLTSRGLTSKFKVTSFVHDAQMNSTLCSSTRFLISDDDFQELFGNVGENEYLIEVYFTDSSMASDFQTAYEKAGLPQDGQAVTYTIIFLLSALRDIVMAMVLILASILLVMVALMCIKYTVMATLEEEIKEIGTMKAIGMSYIDIRNLYLVKYKIMLTTGIIIGYLIAHIISNVFTEHVSNTFGKQPISIITISIPLVSCILIYLVTNCYCKKILKKLKNITVVDALVNENGFGKKESVRDGLYKSKSMPVNILISSRETLHNFRGFAVVFVVMFIVSGIIIVPMNFLNTMKSKEFISYMGSSMDDILVEIDSGENLDKKYVNIKKLIEADADIEKYKEFRRIRVETVNSKNEWMNIHIDCGKYSGKGLSYLDGRAPNKQNEIALSKLNMDSLGKSIGDRITLKFNDKEKDFVISGIYQDVTSGGYTAKALDSFAGLDAQKYQFTVNLVDGIDSKEKTKEWRNKIGSGYDIEPMEEFISQTLGGVSRQVQITIIAVAILGILITALIVILFMKLKLAKDVDQIAQMKAIGFTNYDIRKQYLYKMEIVSIIGIIAGTLISNLVGESIVSMAFSMMGLGISKIIFIINPWTAFVILPFVLLLVVAVMTWFSTKQICKYNIISLINE